MIASNTLDAVGLVQLPRLPLSGVAELLTALGSRTDGARSGKFEFIGLQPRLFTDIWEFDAVPHLIRTFCGDRARFDSHFGLNYPGRGRKPNIHGGPGAERRSVWWHDAAGYSYTTNLKIGVALHAHSGFGFIPGSHRAANLQLAAQTAPEDLLRPQLHPGSVVVFTDALVHGTVEARDVRTMLYYTFTPGHVVWQQYAEPVWRSKLPENRQRFVRAPGIATVDPENRTAVHYLPPSFD